MQAEKKKTIVIASVLKPVNDTRMYEKIGLTLASNALKVHIIGFGNISDLQNVVSHPLGNFKRLSLRRIFIQLKIFSKIISIKPDILAITTHELLWLSVLYEIFSGCRLIYDVQENYYRNIIHTDAFPKAVRAIIAGYVRLKEKLLAPFIDHFWIAEKSYAQELTFLGNRYSILENKVKQPEKVRQSVTRNKLLFTGTLAESTGVFVAIALAKKLYQMDSQFHLTIIGYASQPKVLEQVRKEEKEHSFIKLIGGDQLVPHHQIIEEIIHSDFGIISYPPNPSTFGAIPTKLYEYVGYQLPILIIDHPVWKQIVYQYEAGLVFDTRLQNMELMLKSMNDTRFYSIIPTEVYWESQEVTLLKSL